ncbi:MAG: glycosyltransferase [Rikenellaceae bacterium]
MKYSILIPAYSAKFLGRSIESVLSQTYGDFELIIVNDASPENLDSIVKSYNDERVNYYTNEVNCGAANVVDNWNRSLEYSSGEYVICMGDDDELAPNCLEEYNRLMAEYPDLDIYHGRAKLIDEDSEFCRLQEARPPFESVYSLIWHRMSGRLQYIGDFLYRRSRLIANGGFYKMPLGWGSDDISAYIAAKDRGIANTNIPIFHYRVNSQSISTSGDVMLKLRAIDIRKEWILDFVDIETTLSEIDSYYCEMIRSGVASHFRGKRVFEISRDLSRHNIFRIIYWLRDRDVKITKRDLLKALIKSRA